MEWKIYKITNAKNGKVYIGQTKNKVQARFMAHLTAARLGTTFRFYHAIRKYGAECFSVEEICTAGSLEEANQLEQKYILEYKSNDSKYGYNGTIGGTGGWMISRLSEEKQKEWREAVGKAATGEGNGRYCGTTDEEIKSLLVDFANRFKYICGLMSLVGYGVEEGMEVPKHFTKFRFGGDYKNLAEQVAKEVGIEYDPYVRGEKRKISQHYKELSKQRKMSHKVKDLKTFEGKIEKIRNSKLGDKNYQFCGTTNDQLIELVCKYLEQNKVYPSHKELITYGKEIGISVPSAFTKTRFSGRYTDLIKVAVQRTGIEYIEKRKHNGPHN